MKRSLFTPILLSISLAVFNISGAFAIDHGNLDEDRPLRVEDPYSIEHGELEVEAGFGFSLERRDDDRAFFPVELLYGAYPNLQIGIGTSLSTDETDEEATFGDVELGALYNFNQETLRTPAFGVRAEVTLPTGIDSPGTSARLKGLATKSFGNLSAHGNAAYQYLNGDREGERDNRLEFILGGSYPVGAPGYTRLTVIGDVFTDVSVEHDDSSIVGSELGLRYQLSQRTVLDAGIGSEFAGASERSALYFVGGVSFAF